MNRELLFHLENVALAVFWTFFVWINVEGYLATGKLALLFAAIDTTLVTLLFAARKRPRATSDNAVAWGVAFSATFLLLLLRPTDNTNGLAFGTFLILMGLGIVIASLLFLGRSFAIVPSLRDVKTRGPYAIVRHPMYAGHMLSAVGYLLVNPTIWNGSIVVAAMGLLLYRISLEEEFLNQDESYCLYTHATTYRLVPFVY